MKCAGNQVKELARVVIGDFNQPVAKIIFVIVLNQIK